MKVTPPSPPYLEAKHHGGAQDKIKWVVLHSTVSPCKVGEAEHIAEMFHDTDRFASAHYTVDPEERWQCVKDHVVAYHCGYNYGSIAIEMCEYPSEIIERWDDPAHIKLERNAAHLTARLCIVYGVRPYFVGRLGLLAGIKGVTTHAQMSKAFHKSTHWDPGAWRRKRFMREVRKHYKFLKTQ
jgi:N-acetylmuramoyl-L-alanine amidase CwlA